MSKEKVAAKRENVIITAFALFGVYILNILQFTFIFVGRAIRHFFSWIWSLSTGLRRGALELFKLVGMFLMSPFIKVVSAVREVRRRVGESHEKHGKLHAFFTAMEMLFKILFGKRGVLTTLFNYVCPVLSIVFLFSVVTYANSLNYAVKLTVNGQFLGYIANEQVFLDSREVLQDRINYLGSVIDIEANAEYSIEQIGYSETLTKYQIADLILQNSGVSLEYGYAFYINDVFYGALTNFHEVEQTLNSLLDAYETDNPTETVKFVDSIRYNEAGLYLSDSIIDEEWLIDLLTSTKTVSRYYTVEYGDSHSLVADKIDLTTAEIEALNPGFSENDLHVGDRVRMNAEEPFLSISITKTETYDVKVEYDTETYNDETIYEGSSRTTRVGEYGENRVTADVTYINGVESDRQITNVEIITLPVSEQIAIGVRPTPAGTYNTGTAAYGKFMWPLGYGVGTISQLSHWDGGYAGHVGVDISGIPYGEPVYAGAAGVVTYAGSSSGLGYYVKIWHEDLGVYSTYAHNSTLYVSAGESVAQGQCIAGAGETGRAQGIHVHFAIQLANGTNVNPIAYMDIPSWVPWHLV